MVRLVPWQQPGERRPLSCVWHESEVVRRTRLGLASFGMPRPQTVGSMCLGRIAERCEP